jgi:hypothetical protein
MPKRIGSLFIIFLICAFASAQVKPNHVRFYGNNSQYAGMHIVFERYANFIIPETTPLASMPIDDNGDFDFIFPLNEVTYAFANLGQVRAYIYLEPGYSYELILPAYTPKSVAEKINPHFQYQETIMGIANDESRQLNRNITEFTAEFNYLLNSNAVDLFVNSNAQKAQEIETSLQEKYTFEHPVFSSHKKLMYLKLWHMTLRRQDRKLIHEYLSNHPVEFNIPAYWDVFNTLFKGFFPAKFSREIIAELNQSINSVKRFDSIIDVVAKDTLFVNRELAETVMLQGLYEAFYNKKISESVILTITNSASENASSENIKTIASQINRKMNMLRPGTSAPDFSLRDAKGKLRTLSDYQGKFVYLSFIHTQNFSALRDLQTLEQFNKLYRRELEIITIVIDDDFDEMIKLLDETKYKWDFLHFAASPRVLWDYNIVATPAYYLIDPNGNLSLSPAPAPEENFRDLFAERFRDFQRDHLRRNPPRERSIFRW